MPSRRFEEVRDYAFADQALALRKRAGLTQRDLALLLHVSSQAIHAWEGGLSYPGTEHLKQMIALYLERGALMDGREEEEAAALWASVRAKAARRTPPFDPTWLAALLGASDGAVPAAALPPPAATVAASWHDWGDAPAAPSFQGRAHELAVLARWVREERCRVIEVLGVGGIGKTTLAARVAYELAPEFAVVYWRSLRNALPVEDWLAGAIAALSAGQIGASQGLTAQLGLLLELLRTQRGLLVLDNMEAILEPGALEVGYRAGYEDYGMVLQQLAESAHQGILLLTSREQPLRADDAVVRSLRLEGLGVDAGRALLVSRDLAGDAAAWRTLVERYTGNPLALSVVGETISVVFGGDIAAFLAQDVAVFGGIRQLLDEQMVRLSTLEQAILNWLALEREPVRFADLVADLGPGVARADAVEAVEALQRRSLLEWGPGGTFTPQPVVLEYITSLMVETLACEILVTEPVLLVRQLVLKATAKDYVRRSQERLIAQPLLERLSSSLGSADAVEQRLLGLLGMWRGRAVGGQGYGPGNVVNLLRLLRGNLSGLDLSHLAIRHAYLQGVEAQDASLAETHLSEAVLDEAFNYPTAVALSADGASLVAGTSTGEVFLWQVADRRLLLGLQGHAGGVWAVALSGDGRLVASASYDRSVKLWAAPSGQLLATLQGHTNGVRSVALSGDGQLLASGSEDGTVKLWAAPSGRLLATLQGHTGAVRNVALSTDGQLVASGSYDGSVKLWAVPSGQLLITLDGHAGAVPGVALSGDGQLVASGSYDGSVKLWAAPSGQLLTTLQGHNSAVLDVALSTDGQLVASGSFDGSVKLWVAPSGGLIATLQGHTGAVRNVALSGDGRLLASGSEDGTVKLWAAPSGRLLATLQGHTSAIPGVALSGDGQWVASANQDGTANLWETGSGYLRATLQGHTGAVQGVALSTDGQLVVSGSFDGSLKLWAAPGGQLLATLQGHTSEVRSVALSGDGRLVASGSEDGTVKLWAAPGGQLLATLQGHTGAVYAVALSSDGRLVASGSQDGTARLWEARSGRLLANLQGHTGAVPGVALSGDGRLVASGSQDGTIRLWEAASTREAIKRSWVTFPGHASGILGVALSTDGQLVASGSFDGSVKLWAAPSGQLLATLLGHTSGVRGVALSADGQLVASGSYDGTVKLWSALTGACLRTLRPARPYERTDLTGMTGVTEAQRAVLLALGALERVPAHAAQPTQAGAPHPGPAPGQESAVGAMPTPALEQSTAYASTRPPTNLPPARTTFVGRSEDLAVVIQALEPATRTGARLLTLSGVAGCGKTRLALAVAEAASDTYENGVWLVELAPLSASAAADPTAVVAATLTALGLHEQPGQDLLDTLVAHLRPRRLLLLLDNCEHLADACASLAARLLGACPKLQILTTSQRILGIADETVWRVSALAMPPALDSAPTPEALQVIEKSDAVRLFVERAQAVQPTFALSAATAANVAAICRRLDGLPLAIELAAARLHVLPVEEILARLDDRFRLLRRGGRAVTVRHQTLQATMDWSYGLLDAAEQAVLRRLAVFAGGWDLAAAEQVCAARLGGSAPRGYPVAAGDQGRLGGSNPVAAGDQGRPGGSNPVAAGDQGVEVAASDLLGVLDELLDRSLVYVQQTHEVPRYGLLETVRQYGAQHLERLGEAAGVRDRHLAWCAMLAEQAAPALLGPEQTAWLARLDREHDNLRAALQWALDRGQPLVGLRVAAALWQFWRSRSHLSEGRRWLAALLAQAADAEDAASMALRATALEGAAWLTEDEHEFAQASALFAQSDALRRALGQDEYQSGLRINAAMEARARGDYARATVLLEESLAQHRVQGTRESIKRGGLGLSLARLALVLAEQGEQARATALYEECLTLHRELGDQEGSGNALLGLGDIARDQGDTVRVRAYCEETLALFRDLGHTWVGFSLNNLALAAYLDGDLMLAARYAAESEALFRGLQAEPSLAEVLVTVGRVKGAQGDAAAARASLAEALALAWAKGPRFVVAAALEELGVQAVRRGHEQHGVQLLAAVARLRRAMGTVARPIDRPVIEGLLAMAHAALSDTAYAEAWAAGETLPLEKIVTSAADDA